MKRTGYCGALREKDIGSHAVVMGWAQNKRDMGGVIFIDLRDREGVLQVVLDAQTLSPQDFSAAESLKLESVVAVSGEIQRRGEIPFKSPVCNGGGGMKGPKIKNPLSHRRYFSGG